MRQWLAGARQVAVLTGAGMSAESGVPTFRDALTGWWSRFKPEELATEAAYRAQPQMVWDWYLHRRELVSAALPNAGHRALAAVQQREPPRWTLVTQNVDDLHQRAGSPGVIALHGQLAQDRWLDAERACCAQGLDATTLPPACRHCGNLRRPAVVWFGESLPAQALALAEQAVQTCDVLLVVGTSGVVYPAAGLVFTAHQHGAQVVLVNPEPSELDTVADACLRQTAALCLPTLLEP